MQKVGIVLLIILGVLLLLGGAGLLGFGGFGMDSGMMSGIGTTISPLYLALIISAGVLIVVLLARAPGHAGATASSALDISKMRYAKGEINKEQFDAIKRDLRA